MDEKAIRGIPWTIFSYGANRVVSVATTIVLARLLVPGDFGLFAMATLGTGFISIFSGLGLGTTLVLRQDLDRRGQGTVLTMLLIAGAAFAAVLAALAPLLAIAFDEPRLTGVLLALAGILSFSGVNWFYESLLQRELEFRRRFVTEMARTVVFSAVALALASTGSGVWALVGAHIAGHIANGVAQLVLAPYRVRPSYDGEVARDAMRTGAGFLAQNGAGFLQQNLDYIVVGRVLSAGPLGYYSMAYRQAELPFYAIAEPVSRVTFPGFARMRHRGEDIIPAFLAGLRLVALATFPVAIVLSAAAGPFTRALFGSEWLPMIGPMSVLGIWAVVRPLEATISWLLNSVGRAGFVGKMSMGLLVPLAPVLWIAADQGGITAVAWVMLGHMFVAIVMLALMIRHVTGLAVSTLWGALRGLVLAATLAWVTTRLVAWAFDDRLPWLALIACTLTALASYAAGVRLADPPLLSTALRQVRRSVSRSAPPDPAGSPA